MINPLLLPGTVLCVVSNILCTSIYLPWIAQVSSSVPFSGQPSDLNTIVIFPAMICSCQMLC